MSNPYAPPSSSGTGADDPEHGTGAGAEGTPPASEHGSPPVPGPPAHPPGPGRPSARGVTPAERPAPDPEAVRAASRRVTHFGLFMLASLVTAALPLPWQLAALVFALAAVVMGVRALIAVWQADVRGALLMVVAVGLVLATLVTVSMATMLALWPLQMERQTCLRDALTISAQERCETAYQDGLRGRLEQLGRG